MQGSYCSWKLRMIAKGLGVKILSIYYLNPSGFSNKRVVREEKDRKFKRDEEMKKVMIEQKTRPCEQKGQDEENHLFGHQK